MKGVALLGLVLVLAGCGGAGREDDLAIIDQVQARDRQAVANEVKLGKLPPIAMQMFDSTTSIQPDWRQTGQPEPSQRKQET